MKLPNKYGSVYKLSGKRRNPWTARKTVGWKQIEDKKKAYPIYEFIGYYPTRAEALQALATYNISPYDLQASTLTFEDIYNKWSEVHYKKIKGCKGYKTAFKTSEPLWRLKFTDIKLEHLQKCIDTSGKNAPALKIVKSMWGLMYEYAVMHELVPSNKKDIVRYVDISNAGNPNAIDRQPFSTDEVKTLWELQKTDSYISTILMLIYTGCRISELLDLKKDNVNIEGKYFEIVAAKTKTGVRKVPISQKVLPFFKEWLSKNDSIYLLSTPDAKHLGYWFYVYTYWRPIMDRLSIDHTPHCTRHTCISMLATAGVDERLIKKIVGHKGQGVTDTVYTHFEIQPLLEAINKI